MQAHNSLLLFNIYSVIGFVYVVCASAGNSIYAQLHVEYVIKFIVSVMVVVLPSQT